MFKRNVDSIAARFRKKRFRHFERMLSVLPRPLHVLDIGGTEGYWRTVGFTDAQGVRVTLLNLRAEPVSLPNFESVVGNARNLSEFADLSIDVVYSNSVIEHVGGFEHQRQMAMEVQRVGKRFYVQTPNRHFPIEPHFLFPFFQFLAPSTQVWLVRHFSLGWYSRAPDAQTARKIIGETRLLTKHELSILFPGAALLEERVLGVPKSFSVYGGWH